MASKLYMIPTLLGEGSPVFSLAPDVLAVIRGLRYFIVENEKNARRFLVGCGMKEVLHEVEFALLSEHTKPEDYSFIMEPLMDGISAGIMSDAGCPGVADPGAELVNLAHLRNIELIPLTGPSSILLALMASGLNGQQFAFRGYLPVKTPQRIRRIKDLAHQSGKTRETQIFIEAPYRNNQLLKDLVDALPYETRLCIASNISQADQMIQTKSVNVWKKKLPDLNKKPTVFLFLV